MKHAEEADLGAQMLGIGATSSSVSRRSGTSSRRSREFVLQCQRRELVRQCEDHMEIVTGSSSRRRVGQPAVARVGLALRTMAVAARIIAIALKRQ